MSHPPCLLAIDVGTSRTRASLVAPDGAMLAQAGRRRAPGADGNAGLLWNEVSTAVRELAGGVDSIIGIGVASQLGMALIDRHGEPLEELSPWSDKRPAAQAAALRERAADEIERIAHRRVAVESMACKLMRTVAETPELLERADWAFSIKDLLNLKLTGRVATDPVHASYTSLFDVVGGHWSPVLLQAAGVAPELMPEVLPVAASLGPLLPAVATELGVRAGVPVAVGASDGTLGSIGAGAVRPGRAVDVAGSTDVLFVAHDRPPTLSGVEAVTNPHPIPGMFFVGGPTGLTGGGIERLMALLGYDSSRDARDALGPELDSIPPGSAGLRIDPCLTGSRFPRWRERDRGVVAGLSLGHTRAHLYQAAQEGSAFVVAEGIDALHAVGIEFDEIVVVGGVASNHALLQLRCDAWDIPVRASAEPEASSLGTAMVAAVAAGLYGDIGEAATAMVRPGLRFEPDREVASALAVARAEWLAMERPEAPPETFA